jgi:integrase
MAGCRPLTLAEVEHVSRTFANDFQEQRNKALFIVGVKTGFRISELLSLKVSDVYQRGQVVDEVTVAKRNRKQQTASHTLPLHQQARRVLGHWLTSYQAREQLLPGHLPLFPARQGGHKAISRVRAFQMLMDAFHACGLTGRLGTHILRKTFAITMYERLDENIFKVQQVLGHKWVTSTQNYLPSMSTKEMKRAILA